VAFFFKGFRSTLKGESNFTASTHLLLAQSLSLLEEVTTGNHDAILPLADDTVLGAGAPEENSS